MTKFVVIRIFRPTCAMQDGFKVHFSFLCVFFFVFFCFAVLCDLVHNVETAFHLP